MLKAAKYQPTGKKIAEALQEEFMRALRIHYPTPHDPLHDVAADVKAVGDKFSVNVRPAQLENYDWERQELFERAHDNAWGVVNSFQAEFGVPEKADLKLSEWMAKLNAYFISKNANVISNPMLTTQRGQAHA